MGTSRKGALEVKEQDGKHCLGWEVGGEGVQRRLEAAGKARATGTGLLLPQGGLELGGHGGKQGQGTRELTGAGLPGL